MPRAARWAASSSACDGGTVELLKATSSSCPEPPEVRSRTMRIAVGTRLKGQRDRDERKSAIGGQDQARGDSGASTVHPPAISSVLSAPHRICAHRSARAQRSSFLSLRSSGAIAGLPSGGGAPFVTSIYSDTSEEQDQFLTRQLLVKTWQQGRFWARQPGGPPEGSISTTSHIRAVAVSHARA